MYTFQHKNGYELGTYDYSPLTPDGLRIARRKILAVAKAGRIGQYALYCDNVCYLREADRVVRVEKNDAGRTLSERVVWRDPDAAE